MIGASFSMMTIVTVNDPVTPVFSAPATMTSTNGSAGSGTFSFQFNATKRTATTNATGSVSGSGASSFQYFNVGALVDPQDYEVMVTLGTATGNSNIAAAGGSATLGVWIRLDTSPLYTFSCSTRTGGASPVDITIRHRVSTGTSATTSITLNQSSDAVVPTFSGAAGTTTTITKTFVTNAYGGVYIDDETAANAGRVRAYKDGALTQNIGFGFTMGSVPESEYEFQTTTGSVSPSGAMTPLVISGWRQFSTARAVPAAFDSGTRYLMLPAFPAGTGVITLQVRHKFDNAKIASANFTFQTI